MVTFLLNAAASAESSNAAGAQGSMMTTLVTFVLIILIFYFLMIRPQKKKDKEAREMLNAMKKGDKVEPIGGIHGTVIAVKEQTVIVKVDDNTRLEFSKSAISQVVDKAKQAPVATGKKDKKAETVEKIDASRPAWLPLRPRRRPTPLRKPKRNEES
jgi:preprotein translocase subunit YajC